MTPKSARSAVGIDVGSGFVRCVVGMMEPTDEVASIIGSSEVRNNGVRKGVVVDIEATVSAITAAADEAERMAGVQIKSATVGVNGQHLISLSSHGIITLGNTSRDINEDDLARVEQAASVLQLPPNRETIQVYPQHYSVDGQEDIVDPLGMSGLRLELDSCLVTAGTPFLKNLSRSVNQAGFSINHLVAGPLASAAILLTSQEKELGCVLVDFGAMSTGVAVFEENKLLHVSVLPVGSAHITSDLAVGLRTDIQTAEKVKIEHVALESKSGEKNSRNIRVKQISGEDLVVTQQQVNSISEDRLEEIFKLVNSVLKKTKKEAMLPGGVILCGGGARLKNIDEFAKGSLRLPARVAKPEGFAGMIDRVATPAYATAVGLMAQDLKGERPASNFGGALESGKKLFGNLLNRLRK